MVVEVLLHIRKSAMFMVSAIAKDTVRTTFLEKGEWPAVAELRRFYRIDDNEIALRSVNIFE